MADSIEDEWAAALAEQAAAENAQSAATGNAAPAATPKPANFEPLAKTEKSAGGSGEFANDIDLVLDIPVQLTVELGRTKIPIKNILQLAQGSVVELDGLAGEPMDVLVNGCLIAQGEVVVVNEKFGIRLTDIITPSERIRRLANMK
ncbi:MAG: flagellar motor switch protein FliN [Pseudomonadota bacterium]|nr:MAG: flagellar motor switch protein FliN [Pseudomonadota bacterium]